MEGLDMAVAEQSVETPVDAPEASPATESSGGDEQQVSGSQPAASNRGQARFQKILNENRQYREQVKQFEEFKRSNEAGINFHNSLVKQNPQALQVLIEMNDLMMRQGRKPEEIRQVIQEYLKKAEVSPYSEYDKPIQDLAQKTLTAEQKLEQVLARLDQQEKGQVTSHQQMLDSEFDRRLVQDGFINQDGKYNELEVFLVSNAVRTLLDKYARDPQKPSLEEMEKAYGLVKETLRKQGGKALKSVGKAPSVPPSGSKKGQASSSIPGAKRRGDTIDEMIAMLD